MAVITLGDVSVGCRNDNAQVRATARLDFRNPRGLNRFYSFYIKDVGAGDIGVYGWSTDGYTWAGGQVDLAGLTTVGNTEISMTYVEDAVNFQTIVYFVGRLTLTNAIRLRRGTIADAASIIVWDAEEQLYGVGLVGYNPTIGIDNNGYLWSGTRLGVAPNYTWDVKVSVNARPNAPIAWSADTTLRAGGGNPVWHITCTPYGNGMVFIGWVGGYLWACYSQQGNPPTDEGESMRADFWIYSGGNHAVTDADGLVHLSYGVAALVGNRKFYYHRTWNPALDVWGARSTIYDGEDDTDNRAALILDTSRVPNYLYAIYEHGTGVIEYKTSPADAISWSAATTIEDHAENCRMVQAWYYDDPIVGGNIFGTFLTLTTDTVRAFLLDFAIPPGVAYTDVKEKGWPRITRMPRMYLDGDTFVGQDTRRWNFLVNDTGFLWNAQGQVTIPANRQMTTKETYAYALLLATVSSADISDCAIGFYADANHYVWIDRDYFRVRSGLAAERIKFINWKDNTFYRILLAWTQSFSQLRITNVNTDRTPTILQFQNTPQIEANVTFQVVVGGSSLLVQDYSLFHADVWSLHSFGIVPSERMVLTTMNI